MKKDNTQIKTIRKEFRTKFPLKQKSSQLKKMVDDLNELKSFLNLIENQPTVILLNDPNMTEAKLKKTKRKIQSEFENLNTEIILLRHGQ